MNSVREHSTLPGEEAITILPEALGQIQKVLLQLESHGVSFCHWKSNFHIDYALSGSEDLDLLVHERDFAQLQQVLLSEHFRQADSEANRLQPGVFHFLGNDSATGTLINFHVYTRILTGDHFMKSWALPFEEMLLADTRRYQEIRLPSVAAEHIIFVLRGMIKHSTALDIVQLMRIRKSGDEEYRWLSERARLADSHALLARYFPEISPLQFDAAWQSLSPENIRWSRLRLSRQFVRALGKYRRYSPIRQSFATAKLALGMAMRKFGKGEKHMQFLTGGKLVAFVGPQAVGKSTLIRSLKSWLGTELAVQSVHVGKPPATLLTWLPKQLIPLARRLKPEHATTRLELSDVKDYPLIFVLRKVMLAYDRQVLLRKMFRRSRCGKIVLCDRYPSDVVGAVDGPTFTDAAIDREPSGLKASLMKLERALYRNVCPPDLVVQLSVPSEIAVRRNTIRNKKNKQTNEYVLARHEQLVQPRYDRGETLNVSTLDDLDDTVLQLKRDLWMRL